MTTKSSFANSSWLVCINMRRAERIRGRDSGRDAGNRGDDVEMQPADNETEKIDCFCLFNCYVFRDRCQFSAKHWQTEL